MSTSIVERISKALALAERSSGAEAELAFAKAQELATLYAVDLEVARRSMANREKRETPVQRAVRFDTGLATRNTKKSLVRLFIAIGNANDVKCDIAYNSATIYPHGFPSDIDLVERMFAVIAPQMVAGATAYLATGEHRQETAAYYDPSTYTWTRKPVDGRTARINYYAAFVGRIGERLMDMRRQAEASVAENVVTVVAADGAASEVSTALVLKEKALEVADYYKQTSTARGSWRGSSAAAHSSSARSAGSRDGSRARLGREAQIGGSRTAVGR